MFRCEYVLINYMMHDGRIRYIVRVNVCAYLNKINNSSIMSKAKEKGGAPQLMRGEQ